MATGTQIRSVAQVTFDVNPPIATDQVSETDPTQGHDPDKQALVSIDSGPPTSHVYGLLPTENSTSFLVSWTGSDDASGIASYDIYVSDTPRRVHPLAIVPGHDDLGHLHRRERPHLRLLQRGDRSGGPCRGDVRDGPGMDDGRYHLLDSD